MMREGRILATGTPDEIQEKSQTNSLEEAFIYFGDINENIKVGDK